MKINDEKNEEMNRYKMNYHVENYVERANEQLGVVEYQVVQSHK